MNLSLSLGKKDETPTLLDFTYQKAGFFKVLDF
jgi:hypothetical protein